MLNYFKATSKLVNSAMNYVIGIEGGLANEILNKTLNAHIQNNLVGGSIKKTKS